MSLFVFEFLPCVFDPIGVFAKTYLTGFMIDRLRKQIRFIERIQKSQALVVCKKLAKCF